jgi:hypothetical protein
MPYNWVRISSSPPRERRTEVWDICFSHGGRLCENQIYYDDAGGTYALVELPDDPDQQQALREALGVTEFTGLVHADEKANDISPPPSAQAS